MKQGENTEHQLDSKVVSTRKLYSCATRPTRALHAALVGVNVELPPTHPPRAVAAHEAAAVHGERVHLGDVAAQRRRELELAQVEEVQVARGAARDER